MGPAARRNTARGLGLLAGAGLAAGCLVAWQMPEPREEPGAYLTVTAAAHGELLVRPSPRVLVARSLVPGRVRRGSFELTNITGAPLTVRLRARPSSRALDREVELTVSGEGTRAIATSIGRLHRWTQPFLRLGPGERRRLTLEVRLVQPVGAPTSSGRGQWSGAELDVPLEIAPLGDTP